jgi:hypothetical protein
MRSIILITLLLAGCAEGPRPEPEIRTVTVKEVVPIPCPALAALGPTPEYADSDAAINATEDVGELAKLYVVGRLQRIQRETEYVAAAIACNF